MSEPRVTCDLCGEIFDDLTAVVDHLRVIHPDVYGEGPERWPDGSYVVVDDTLEPGDFT